MIVRRHWALSWLLVALLSATTNSPGKIGPAAALAQAEEGGGTATLLFISVLPGHALTPPVAQVRQAGERALDETARRAGRAPVDAALVLALQQSHRVRTALGLTSEFLDALRTQTGAASVLVGQLFLYHERLALAARALRTDDGVLVWADAAETAAPTPDQDWGETIARLAANLDGWQPTPAAALRPGESLLVLPARASGLEPAEGELLTACLLGELLACGRGEVLDPGLLAGQLQALGRGTTALDATACEAIRRAFGPAPLLVPEIICWDTVERSPALPLPEERGPALRPPERSIMLTLRTVDTSALVVLNRREVYRGTTPSTGWFGVQRSVSPLARYREATVELLAQDPDRQGKETR